MDQVLEKQADMIRYLKQHNEQLSKKVIAISEENEMLRQRLSWWSWNEISANKAIVIERFYFYIDVGRSFVVRVIC